MNDNKEKKYYCTDCGVEADIRYSGFRNVETGKYIVKKDESICTACMKKRNKDFIFF